jgi:hypothetical protein
MTGYTLKNFENDFDNSNSNFHKHINSILDAIGMGRIKKNICNQDLNFLCSMHEISLNQWLFSEFTLNIPRIFNKDYIPHVSWVEAFGLSPNDYFKSELNYFISIQPIFDGHNITVSD